MDTTDEVVSIIVYPRPSTVHEINLPNGYSMSWRVMVKVLNQRIKGNDLIQYWVDQWDQKMGKFNQQPHPIFNLSSVESDNAKFVCYDLSSYTWFQLHITLSVTFSYDTLIQPRMSGILGACLHQVETRIKTLEVDLLKEKAKVSELQARMRDESSVREETLMKERDSLIMKNKEITESNERVIEYIYQLFPNQIQEMQSKLWETTSKFMSTFTDSMRGVQSLLENLWQRDYYKISKTFPSSRGKGSIEQKEIRTIIETAINPVLQLLASWNKKVPMVSLPINTEVNLSVAASENTREGLLTNDQKPPFYTGDRSSLFSSGGKILGNSSMKSSTIMPQFQFTTVGTGGSKSGTELQLGLQTGTTKIDRSLFSDTLSRNSMPVLQAPGASEIFGEGFKKTDCREPSNITFKPMYQGLKKKEVDTGHKNEKIVFSERCKVFRNLEGTFTERGKGNMEIYQNIKKNNARLVLRQEVTLKIRLNQALDTMEGLTRVNDRRVRWVNIDFGNPDYNPKEGKALVFLAGFKSAEITKKFFEMCTSFLNGTVTESSTTVLRQNPVARQSSEFLEQLVGKNFKEPPSTPCEHDLDERKFSDTFKPMCEGLQEKRIHSGIENETLQKCPICESTESLNLSVLKKNKDISNPGQHEQDCEKSLALENVLEDENILRCVPAESLPSEPLKDIVKQSRNSGDVSLEKINSSGHKAKEKVPLVLSCSNGISKNPECCYQDEISVAMSSNECVSAKTFYGVQTEELCWFRDEVPTVEAKDESARFKNSYGINIEKLCRFGDKEPSAEVLQKSTWCNNHYGTRTEQLCWFRDETSYTEVSNDSACNDTVYGIHIDKLSWFEEEHTVEISNGCDWYNSHHGIQTEKLYWFRNEVLRTKVSDNSVRNDISYGIQTNKLCWFQDDEPSTDVSNKSYWYHAPHGIFPDKLAWFREDEHDGESVEK